MRCAQEVVSSLGEDAIRADTAEGGVAGQNRVPEYPQDFRRIHWIFLHSFSSSRHVKAQHPYPNVRIFSKILPSNPP